MTLMQRKPVVRRYRVTAHSQRHPQPVDARHDQSARPDDASADVALDSPVHGRNFVVIGHAHHIARQGGKGCNPRNRDQRCWTGFDNLDLRRLREDAHVLHSRLVAFDPNRICVGKLTGVERFYTYPQMHHDNFSLSGKILPPDVAYPTHGAAQGRQPEHRFLAASSISPPPHRCGELGGGHSVAPAYPSAPPSFVCAEDGA